MTTITTDMMIRGYLKGYEGNKFTCDQKEGTDPLNCTYDVNLPLLKDRTEASWAICSVSTSLATFPLENRNNNHKSKDIAPTLCSLEVLIL